METVPVADSEGDKATLSSFHHSDDEERTISLSEANEDSD